MSAAPASIIRALTLHKPPDDLDFKLFQRRRLHEYMDVNDHRVLAKCLRHPVDVETLDVDSYRVLWLMARGLITFSIDRVERVWIRTTSLGQQVHAAWRA